MPQTETGRRELTPARPPVGRWRPAVRAPAGPSAAADLSSSPPQGPGGSLRPRLEDRLSVRLLGVASVVIGRLYHRTFVRAPQRLPRRGPAILVCNHISGLDPVLLQSVCPRAIVWMMAKEYYDIPALKWLFELIEAIPVDRGGRDLAATRAALRALGDGRVLGVFPEGRIEKTRDLLPFQTGVAMMAIKTGVPVFPAHIEGTQRGQPMLRAYLTPNEATLRFGPAVTFDRSGTSRDHLEAATDRIRAAIEGLRRAGSPPAVAGVR